MKLALYIEHGVGNGVGGAELMMAHLASVWSNEHDVDLVHHRPPLTNERIAAFSDDDFSRVNVRIVPREPEPTAAANPFRRYRNARDWHRTVSERYDLFVNCTHWVPCFNHAKIGVFISLFPFYVRPTEMPEIKTLSTVRRLKHRAYYDFEWRRRMATYERGISISAFTRDWTARRWGVDTLVIHPPVDVQFPLARKENLILSVGRFSTMAHTKKQLEMMRAFTDLARSEMPGFAYASVGGLNSRDENRQYFERVREEGRGLPTTVQANLDRASLRQLFAQARIYWHATGLDEDTDTHPELCEHFGISTVEAMAAGCVPVVINKGGQAEIVQHGVNGFRWNTLDELKRYTALLAYDRALTERMSQAARQRAEHFTRDRFVEQMSAVCGVTPPSAVAARHRAIATPSRAV